MPPSLKPFSPGHSAISTPVYPDLSSESLLFEGLKRLLCWDYTNIYWALSTGQTPSKPFACINALNPQKPLWGRLTCSPMRKLRPRKVNNIPKGSELENSSSGVWTQTGQLQSPSFLPPPWWFLPNLMISEQRGREGITVYWEHCMMGCTSQFGSSCSFLRTQGSRCP